MYSAICLWGLCCARPAHCAHVVYPYEPALTNSFPELGLARSSPNLSIDGDAFSFSLFLSPTLFLSTPLFLW